MGWLAIGVYLRTPTWNSFSSDSTPKEVTITFMCTMAGLLPTLFLESIMELPCLQPLQARPTSFLSLSQAIALIHAMDLQQVITVSNKVSTVIVTVTGWGLIKRGWRVRELIPHISLILMVSTVPADNVTTYTHCVDVSVEDKNACKAAWAGPPEHNARHRICYISLDPPGISKAGSDLTCKGLP